MHSLAFKHKEPKPWKCESVKLRMRDVPKAACKQTSLRISNVLYELRRVMPHHDIHMNATQKPATSKLVLKANYISSASFFIRFIISFPNFWFDEFTPNLRE